MKISYEQENPRKDMLLVNQFEPFYQRMRNSVVIVQAHNVQLGGGEKIKKDEEMQQQKKKKKHPRHQSPRNGNRRRLEATSRCEGHGAAYDKPNSSESTGVFINERGLILTCAHVVDGYNYISVRPVDGVNFIAAEIVDVDEKSDLALLRVPTYESSTQGRDYVELAPLDSVTVGMQVFCISNSFGITFSFAVGQVAYPCSNLNEAVIEDGFNHTRGYRVLQDVWSASGTVDPMLSPCDKNLKLIQINNMHGQQGGSGAAIFDACGYVVGIYICFLGTIDFAIHVSCVQEFIDKVKQKNPELFGAHVGEGKRKEPDQGSKDPEKGQKKGNNNRRQRCKNLRRGNWGGVVASASLRISIEEKHRDPCRLVIQFIPPTTHPQLPGSVFRTFLENLLLKIRGAERNLPPPGLSSNSILVPLFTVILHFFSEEFAMDGINGWMKGCKTNPGLDDGFLHKGGQQSFPLALFLENDPHRVDISRRGGSYNLLAKSHPLNADQVEEVIQWEEGCMDVEETRVTHLSLQKPCCCSSYDIDFARGSKNYINYIAKGSRGHCSSIPERSAHVATERISGSLNDEIDKPSTSDQSDSEFDYRPVQQVRIVPRDTNISSATLNEEELLDAMLLLYHLGLAPNFKQASSYMSHQSQSISLLEETDAQIRERATGEQLKRLNEARSVYREDVRHCAWYRISLFTRSKQRGMQAACIWIVQLLLVLSKLDSVFISVPEFYLETLVDCFHVLCKSDPPFVPAAIFIKQGLASFVTFVATHFNDPRISSAELRDLLLQSISVLVQYKDILAAFESNEAATQSMLRALLSAFDNRSWIPVTNIFQRLCKGSGFGSSKHGESSSSSVAIQELLREARIQDEELFSSFLNRLFNTLSWAMTEFSFSIREMQEKYKVMEFQQRKCSVIFESFDPSCNLAMLLEFCTREIPPAFLVGADTNMRRLIELIVFILSQLTSVADPKFFDLTLRRPGQPSEKVNRGMILALLVGKILNLLDANAVSNCREKNDMLGVFASMDSLGTVLCGFQYLLDYNWIEEKHGDLCRLVIQFMPPTTHPQLPGSVFRTFLENLLLKNRGAERNLPPPGVSSNSVLISLFTVIPHFLSEGFAMDGINGWMKGCKTNAGPDVGFLHKGGQQSFPLALFLKIDPQRVHMSRLGRSYNHLAKSYPLNVDQEEEVIRWEEGCMADEETRVTQLSRQKPCCCSSYDIDFVRGSKNYIRYMAKGSRAHCSLIPERSAHLATECSSGSLNDEIVDTPSASDQSDSEFDCRPVQQVRIVPRNTNISSATLNEEELLDAMLLLYHLGLALNFKQEELRSIFSNSPLFLSHGFTLLFILFSF